MRIKILLTSALMLCVSNLSPVHALEVVPTDLPPDYGYYIFDIYRPDGKTLDGAIRFGLECSKYGESIPFADSSLKKNMPLYNYASRVVFPVIFKIGSKTYSSKATSYRGGATWAIQDPSFSLNQLAKAKVFFVTLKNKAGQPFIAQFNLSGVYKYKSKLQKANCKIE